MKEIIARNGYGKGLDDRYVVATISNKEAKKYFVGDFFKTTKKDKDGIIVVAMVEIVEIRGYSEKEQVAREKSFQKSVLDSRVRRLDRWIMEENRIFASKRMKEENKKKKIAECEEAIQSIKKEIEMLRKMI